MLAERIKTAVILLAVALLCLFVGGFLLNLLALIIAGCVTYEYYTFATNLSWQRRSQCVCIALLPVVSYLLFGLGGLVAASLVSASLMLILLCVFVESDSYILDFENVVPACLLGLVYPGAFCASFVYACDALPREYLLWFLSIIISADTFAYFGGSLIGGPKFSERISPKKTVSGACVGLISASVIAYFLAPVLAITGNPFVVVAFSFLIAVMGVFGDLSESLIKRVYSVKDSGHILPGHGGVLDRVDALIFAAPMLLLAHYFLTIVEK